MQKDEDFSNRVRKYREREGISQDELAKRLGMSRNYVSMIEGGKQPSDQVVRHFELLELAPPTGVKSPFIKEATADYRILTKVIQLNKVGTDEQKAMIDAFLDTLLERAPAPPPESDQS